MKWLFLFLGAYLFYLWLKGKKKAELATKARFKAGNPEKSKPTEPEIMVQCQYCGLHLPQSEALAQQGRFYCSKEHLQGLDQSGWLGAATWFTSPNYDARAAGCSPDLVVLHHISLPPGEFRRSSTTQFIVDFFQNKLDVSLHPYFQEIANQKVSSHFLISRKGDIYQFVSVLNKAWHAGVSSFQGREKCNDFSIGIEMEGDGEGVFEDAQYTALARLITNLRTSYPHLQFAGHSDIAPERKTDPGIFFDWRKFQSSTGISEEKFPYGLHSR